MRNLLIGALLLSIPALGCMDAHSRTDFQSQRGHADLKSAAGMIVANAGEFFTIERETGEQMVFQIDDASLLPDGLMSGRRVRVEYTIQRDGGLRAERVLLDAMNGVRWVRFRSSEPQYAASPSA